MRVRLTRSGTCDAGHRWTSVVSYPVDQHGCLVGLYRDVLA